MKEIILLTSDKMAVTIKEAGDTDSVSKYNLIIYSTEKCHIFAPKPAQM